LSVFTKKSRILVHEDIYREQVTVKKLGYRKPKVQSVKPDINIAEFQAQIKNQTDKYRKNYDVTPDEKI
jgi:hypothetical protein